MPIVILPDYIDAEIERKLDEAIAAVPDAAKDRAHLRSQLVGYFAEHGRVPDFSIALKG